MKKPKTKAGRHYNKWELHKTEIVDPRASAVLRVPGGYPE